MCIRTLALFFSVIFQPLLCKSNHIQRMFDSIQAGKPQYDLLFISKFPVMLAATATHDKGSVSLFFRGFFGGCLSI